MVRRVEGRRFLLVSAACHKDPAQALIAYERWRERYPFDSTTYHEHRLLCAICARFGKDLAAFAEYPRLVGLQKSQWTQTRFMIHKIHPVLAKWSALDLTPVMLKGAARLCLDPDAQKHRTFRDLDILFPASEISGAIDVLEAEGWVPATGETFACVRAQAPHLLSKNFKTGAVGDIDIHKTGYKDARAAPHLDDALFTNAHECDFFGHRVRVPSPEDRLAMALLHGARDAAKHSDWIVDAAAILDEGRLDWDRFAALVQTRRLSLLAATMLAFGSNRLGWDVPVQALDQIARPAAPRIARSLSDFLMTPHKDPLAKNLTRLQMWPRLVVRPKTAFNHTTFARPMLTRLTGGLVMSTECAALPPTPVGLYQLRLKLGFPAMPVSRRVEFELHGPSRCIAKLRVLCPSTKRAAIVARTKMTLDLAAADFPLTFHVRPSRFLQAKPGSAEYDKYSPKGFVPLALSLRHCGKQPKTAG